MSLKSKIRDLKTDKCQFEIYLVEPEKKDEFNLPYVLVVPENIKNGSKLIVESNNRERDALGNDVDFSTKKGRDFLIENAINEVIGNRNNFGRIEYVKNIEAPIIMPIIPAVNGGNPYYQQLSRESLMINDSSSAFYKIDEQLCKIIEDTKKIISERGIYIADKVFINGYSSSGVFAQRFAFLHPEIIDTVLIGGAGGSIPMPPDCNGSDKLEYPLGTKDYEQLTGKSFDLESYKKINFQYYLAEFEEYRKSSSRKNEFGFKAPMHDMSYMDRSVPVSTGKNLRKIFGINLWKRFIKQLSEYERNGYRIKSEVYQNKIHTNCLIPPNDFENIYEGKEFQKSSRDIRNIRGKKVLDTIQIAIKKIKESFRKKLPTASENIIDTYSQKVESINDIDLGNKIESAIKLKGLDKTIDGLRTKYEDKLEENEGIYDYPLQTALNSEQVIELTQKFFQSIDDDMANKVNDIISGHTKEGNGQFIDLQTYPFDTNLKYYHTRYDTNARNYGTRRTQAMTEIPKQNSNDVVIYVPFKGDLRDVYALVHEISHSFDTKNGDTDTRKVLGEVAPQCMERMLDEFLLNLPQEDKLKYGIDDSILSQDIQDRKITTFISRYDNVISFNKHQGNRVKNSRYMLAQLYQTQFMKANSQDRKQRIISFIKSVEEDNFKESHKVLGLNINRNNSLVRDMYISDMNEEINNIFNSPSGASLVQSKAKQLAKEKIFEK